MQKNAIPVVRDLVLVGGGHSHVQVLKAFGMRPEPGVRLTLISSERQTPYSGMLPGCISGQYTVDDIHINLDRLCQFAGARLICADAKGLHMGTNSVLLEGRPAIRFDALSINCGAVPSKPHAQAITVKPISQFLPKWQSLQSDFSAADVLVIVGAGAGGVELAFAARARLGDAARIVVLGERLLAGHNISAQRRVQENFAQRKIEWMVGRGEAGADGGLTLADGTQVKNQHVLWVTHVEAPDWVRACDLSQDDLGFIKVNEYLQSVDHAHVFAAGDIAHLEQQQRPKSGVYAVRAGPILASNLRALVRSSPGDQTLKLKPYRAQKNHLALLGTGDGEAIASRGAWSLQGRLLWRLKDQIDWRFMRKFNDLPQMDTSNSQYDLLPEAMQSDLPEDSMRCGGCGAKLAADPLRRVLARLPSQKAAHVHLGIGDDAAYISNGGSTTLLTVDGFRSLIDDPYIFGKIAAHHALNDIFAMGGKPTAALSLVTVPLMAEDIMEEDLFQMLSGVVGVLNAHDVPLVGGHTAEGAELSLGLTINGELVDASADSGENPVGKVIAKSQLCLGDHLILTKPLGTGVVMAAAMQGLAPVSSIDAVVAGMDQSNASIVPIAVSHNISALTDVTGFGLAGHLGEMVRGSQPGETRMLEGASIDSISLGVDLFLDKIDSYPHAVDLYAQVQSSLQIANEQALLDYELIGDLRMSDAKVKLLADPQTSGGMLFSIAPENVDACMAALEEYGFVPCDIGVVTQGSMRILVSEPNDFPRDIPSNAQV